MSRMKDLDVRVGVFGAYLLDGMIEEQEAVLAQMERGEDVGPFHQPELMIRLLSEFKERWLEDRQMTVCLAEAFRDWLRSDEANPMYVLESDVVDFEVIGYMARWVELYNRGNK